jgi:hypothetical protein
MACEDSIIAMDTGSVNRFCSPEQTADVGIGASSAQEWRCREWPGSRKSVRLFALVLEEQEQTVFQRLREW